MAFIRSGRLRVTSAVWGCGWSMSTKSSAEPMDGDGISPPARPLTARQCQSGRSGFQAALLMWPLPLTIEP